MGYKTVPNQKVIKVGKEKCDKQNIYAMINIEAMNAAATDLDAGAFKLWMYFSKNQDGYEFALSRQDVEQTFGIKKRQYDGAIKELIDKHYLVQEGEGSNRYTFHELAQYQNDITTQYQNDTRNITNNTQCILQGEIDKVSFHASPSFVGPIIQDTLSISEPVEKSIEEEAPTGEIPSSILASLPAEKIIERKEDKVRLKDIPSPGIYRII